MPDGSAPIQRDLAVKQEKFFLLDQKGVEETATHWVIKGVATTPRVDRVGDIVEPNGAVFEQMPKLLLYHNSRMPIGNLSSAKVTAKGIPFEAKIPKVAEAGVVKDRIDEAIHSIKYDLLSYVSIGFKGIEVEPIDAKDPWGAQRFKKWDWMELSVVTIPANPDAVITGIKSLDDELRAGRRQKSSAVVPDTQAASGQARGKDSSLAPTVPASRAISIEPKKGTVMSTLQEQITSFEAKRQAMTARMTELINDAAKEGRTFEDAEREEHDSLDADVKKIDEHLVILRKAQERAGAAAAPVVQDTEIPAPAAVVTAKHGEGVIRANKQLPPGIGMARYVKAFAFAKGNFAQAAEYAKQWDTSTPEVGMALKAAIAAGTTTDSVWAGPLVYAQDFPAAFLEYLRPQTILGKINGFSQVPFNIRYGIQDGGSTVGWVGQGVGKPVSKLSFTSGSLGFAKAAGIVVITQELARFSSPSAELKVRDDLTAQMAYFLDQQFIDPGVAAVANVSPASVLNGATNVRQAAATWTSMANVLTDVKVLLSTFAANEISLEGAYWVMTPDTALCLGLLLNTGGTAFAFPEINVNGGRFLGLPVVVSNAVPHSVSAGAIVALIVPKHINMADDGQVAVDTSTEASIQMESAASITNNAATPTGSTLVSMWQTNSIAVRVERIINWQRARTYGVGYIDNMHTS